MKRKLSLPLVVIIVLLFTVQIHAADAPQSEKIVYGTSGEGRELAAYRYGSGENVLVVGFAIHGYEDNFDRDGEALVYTAQQVMARLEGSKLPDAHNWTVYILPCMNPDGLYSGWTDDGPGRCTTTYLYNGRLIRGAGIDMNRCFPARFSPEYDLRNYTTAESLACLEAQDLAAFLQQIQGSKTNVLIDVHGWYGQSITESDRILTAFQRNFPTNEPVSSSGGSGYLTTYADFLGYESGLLELPEGICSLSQYQSSGYAERVVACVEDLIRSEPGICDEAGHRYAAQTAAATCTENGRTEYGCSVCERHITTMIPATGHAIVTDSFVTVAFSGENGKRLCRFSCARCGRTDVLGWFPNSFFELPMDFETHF